jgi:multiple sugar transport system ATP-binding protein
VAGFIGSPAMNFIDGRLEEKGFALASGTAISLDMRPLVPVGRKMTYGIRPEQLQIVPIGTPSSIPAAVLIIEPTGSDTTLIVKAEGGTLTVVLRERCFLKPGEAIALKPAAHQAHLFDESGKRIATV